MEILCEKLNLRSAPWLMPFHFGNYPAEQRQMMLVHELAHIQRKDTIWRATLELIAIVFWFHPLVWMVVRRYDDATEKACDDAVLHVQYPAPKYAKTMLAALKPPVTAESGPKPSQSSAPAALRGRMFAVLDKEKHRMPINLAAGVKLLLLFSLVIMPLAFISFSPYPTDEEVKTVDGPEKLKALWRMHLGRGSILPDASGNEHHGNIYGARWVKDAHRGHCLSFDGIDDHLILRAPEMSWTRKPFTLCVWLKPTQNNDGGGLLLRGDRNLTWCSALGGVTSGQFGEREFSLAGTISSGNDYTRRSKGHYFLFNA